MDTPAESRSFARDYGIEFSLLSDVDGAVSEVYAGVTSDSNPLPGVTIIRSDGRIVFRQVASAKDDRMSAAELVATIDRTLGTKGPKLESDGYAALDRLQLRFDGGGAAVRVASSWRGTGVAELTGLAPLGDHVLVGMRASLEPREAPFALDGLVVLRVPVWGVAGAIELGGMAGWTVTGAGGANAGAMVDLWFALSPRWAVEAGASYIVHDPGGVSASQLSVTLGVARLVQIR